MRTRRWLLGLCTLMVAAIPIVPAVTAHAGAVRQVVVPQADRFLPFAITAHVGDTVVWTNTDTDDHTVVSDDAFTTAGNTGTNKLLTGTDAGHGVPGRVSLVFSRPGTFVYYCRFHAVLDAYRQPVAPGPGGGIQDAQGNFGTPMMGIVTVS